MADIICRDVSSSALDGGDRHRVGFSLRGAPVGSHDPIDFQRRTSPRLKVSAAPHHSRDYLRRIGLVVAAHEGLGLMAELSFVPLPTNVVSIASPEERAWERWRVSILRWRAAPTAANREAIRHARIVFEALTPAEGG